MRFGMMLPHYRQVASTDAIGRVAQEAERLGYDSVWVSDQIIVLDEDVERFASAVMSHFRGHPGRDPTDTRQ